MEIGLNSDVQIGHQEYHIQTEDWGWETPFIVTKIFIHGAVVKSYKTSYRKVLNSVFPSDQSIRTALRNQHEKILDCLISGHIGK